MAMSEYEQQILERLERDFSAQLPPDARTRLLRRTWRRPVVLAAIGVPVGLLLMLVALLMNSAGGVALALGAYGVIVGSTAVLAHGAVPIGAVLDVRVRAARTSRTRWLQP